MHFFRRCAGLPRKIKKNVSAVIRRYSLLVPTLFSFLSLIVFVLMTLSVWFSKGVEKTLEEAIYQSAQQHTELAAEQLQLSFREFSQIAAHISLVDGLSQAPLQNSPFENYLAYQKIKEYNITTFHYSDLVFCYEGNPVLFSVHGTCSAEACFPELEDPGAFLQAMYARRTVGLSATASFGAQWEDNRLILVQPLPARRMALFVVDHPLMSSMLSSVHTAQDRGMQVLFSLSGDVLWSSRPMDGETRTLLFSRIRDGASGAQLQVGDTPYIYTHVSVGYGAVLVMLDEISTQFHQLDSTFAMLIAICASILLLGGALLLLSIRHGYAPIAHLVRDVKDSLDPQRELSASDIGTLRQICGHYSALVRESTQNATLFSSDQLRNLFILRIICGQYSDPEELGNLCRWLEVNFRFPCYFACIISFDHPLGDREQAQFSERLRYVEQDQAILCFCLSPDASSAVGIVNVPTPSTDVLHAFGRQMLCELPPICATVGMGLIYDSISKLGKSYIEARAAINYRLIKGRNTWISYDEMNFSGALPPYPYQQIDAYIKTLRTWDAAAIRESLGQITECICENNLLLQQVKCICFELTSAFLREVNSLGTQVAYKLSETYDVFNIAEYESVSELAQKIADFAQIIQQYITERNARKFDELIRRCIACMEENISNPQFSLSSLSEQFGISPQSLRGKFKEATGQTLRDYMTALRVERARRLLTQTDLDINDICTQCGYLDLSSFIRLFRAEVGTSPGRFREERSAKTEAVPPRMP